MTKEEREFVGLDELGREIPDPRPVEWPLGLSRPPTLQEEIARFMRVEIAMGRHEQWESPEEADDFDIDDDEGDIAHSRDVVDMQAEAKTEEELQGFDARWAAELRRREEAKKAPPPPPAKQDLTGQ